MAITSDNRSFIAGKFAFELDSMQAGWLLQGGRGRGQGRGHQREAGRGSHRQEAHRRRRLRGDHGHLRLGHVEGRLRLDQGQLRPQLPAQERRDRRRRLQHEGALAAGLLQCLDLGNRLPGPRRGVEGPVQDHAQGEAGVHALQDRWRQQDRRRHVLDGSGQAEAVADLATSASGSMARTARASTRSRRSPSSRRTWRTRSARCATTSRSRRASRSRTSSSPCPSRTRRSSSTGTTSS